MSDTGGASTYRKGMYFAKCFHCEKTKYLWLDSNSNLRFDGWFLRVQGKENTTLELVCDHCKEQLKQVLCSVCKVGYHIERYPTCRYCHLLHEKERDLVMLTKEVEELRKRPLPRKRKLNDPNVDARLAEELKSGSAKKTTAEMESKKTAEDNARFNRNPKESE